jgi:hypothetical protein
VLKKAFDYQIHCLDLRSTHSYERYRHYLLQLQHHVVFQNHSMVRRKPTLSKGGSCTIHL